MGGGKTTTTTVIKAPPPTQQELDLQKQQIELGERQAEAIDRSTSFTEQFLLEQALTQLSLVKQQASLLAEVGERAAFEFEIDRLNAGVLQRLQELQLEFGVGAAERALELRPVEDELLQQQLQNIAGQAQPGASEQLLNDLAQAQARTAEATGEIAGEASQILIQNLRNAGASPDEIRAAIAQEADLAISIGLSDIETFSRRLGTQLRTVIAPRRGLRPGDSPILDRAGEIQLPGIEQGAQLTRTVRAAEFEKAAEIPGQVQELVGSLGTGITSTALQQTTGAAGIAEAAGEASLSRSEFVAGAAGGQQNLIEAEQQFQQELADAAARNRLALTGTFVSPITAAGSISTGLATGISPNIAGAIGTEQQFRVGTAGTTEVEKKPFDVAAAAGGVGGFLTGAAAVASSITFKTDMQPVTILDKLASIPVEKWRYNWDTHTMHIGPYAEDFNEAFGIGQDNPKVIAIIDYLGVLLGAVKEIDFKLNTMEVNHAT